MHDVSLQTYISQLAVIMVSQLSLLTFIFYFFFPPVKEVAKKNINALEIA